jgi:excisionase family DNA binding protein
MTHETKREGGPPPRLYTASEAKTLLRVAQTKLYQLINDGKLDARKLGSRTLITGESISALIEGLPRLK